MELSIVVTIVDGGRALETCLAALHEQTSAPEMEILVPVDDTVPDVERLRAKFPLVLFPDLGSVPTEYPPDTPNGQHELFDRRRAVGLARAQGAIVAILEDRGIPRPDWALAVVSAHASLPNGVIGGAVENGVDHPLHWAVYLCDFGRYQLPLPRGPAKYATDINVSYKREVLGGVRELWAEHYHETTVHWALQRQGETLFLDPRIVVDQMRGETALAALLRERYHWGRLFAHTRARETTPLSRMVRGAFAPVLPAVLYWRLFRGRLERRAHLGLLLRVSPLVLALLIAWSVGEFTGYLTSRR